MDTIDCVKQSLPIPIPIPTTISTSTPALTPSAQISRTIKRAKRPAKVLDEHSTGDQSRLAECGEQGTQDVSASKCKYKYNLSEKGSEKSALAVNSVTSVSASILAPNLNLNLNSNSGNESSPKRVYADIPENYVRLVNNRYLQGNPGPYNVFIEKVTPPPDLSSSLSVIKLGRVLLSHVPQLIGLAHDFRRVSQGKYSISFSDCKQANEFVASLWKLRYKLFTNETWLAFIPNYRITRQMLIKGIDDDSLDPEFILKYIKPPVTWNGFWCKPVEINRLKKRIPDKDNPSKFIFVDSNLYIATFHNITVSNSAIFLGKTIYFTPFVQRMRRCAHCQRFGHTVKNCKSINRPQFCESCVATGHSSKSYTNPDFNCINCVRNKNKDTLHKASHPDCPVFLLQRDVKRAMATLGLSPREAYEHIARNGPLPKEVRRGWNLSQEIPLPTISDYVPKVPNHTPDSGAFITTNPKNDQAFRSFNFTNFTNHNYNKDFPILPPMYRAQHERASTDDDSRLNIAYIKRKGHNIPDRQNKVPYVFRDRDRPPLPPSPSPSLIHLHKNNKADDNITTCDTPKTKTKTKIESNTYKSFKSRKELATSTPLPGETSPPILPLKEQITHIISSFCNAHFNNKINEINTPINVQSINQDNINSLTDKLIKTLFNSLTDSSF